MSRFLKALDRYGLTPRLLVIFLFAVSTIVMLLPKTTSAAAAQCYLKTGTNVVTYRSTPCDVPEAQLAWTVNSITPQDNKCYLILSWGSMNSSDQGAEPCTTWAGAAQLTGGTPPVCKMYDGNIDDYTAKTADITKLTDISCDELKSQLVASGDITDISRPGLCYMGVKNEFSEGEVSVLYDTCLGILAHFVAAEQAEAQEAASNTAANTTGGGTSAQATLSNERSKNINCATPEECIENNSLVAMIKLAINVFSIMIGIVVTAIIIWGGFTYARAGGDPGTISEAKNRIKNAIIALAMYVFLYAFMMWLVPGGPF